MFKSLLPLCLVFLFITNAFGSMLGERITLDSRTLGEERTLQILLPENYQANKSATYPVIYLLDGDYNFNAVAGMLDLLANKGQRIPDVILVGIADKGTQSYRTYMTPNSIPTLHDKNVNGQANAFLSYLVDEVKPYIEKKYRAAQHTTIVGHSMGGLFVLNALIENPASFTNYVAISPSVWLADNAIVKQAQTSLSVNAEQPVSLFLSLADETQMGQYDFINLLDLTQPDHLTWSFTHYPDENHNSVGIISLRDSLKKIFNGWYLPEKHLKSMKSANDIVTHYQQVMTRSSFQQSIPSASIKTMVRKHYRQKKEQDLPGFIDYASKALPKSKRSLISMQASYAGHFDTVKTELALLKAVEVEFKHNIEHIKSIASAYEKLGDTKTAHHYYQRALVVALQQKAQQWQLNIINAKISATNK